MSRNDGTSVGAGERIHSEERSPHPHTAKIGLGMRVDEIKQDHLPLEPIAGLSGGALQDFCLAVSHDLTEPLRGATCYLELLRRSAGDRFSSEELSFLQTAENSLAELSHLIKGLQDLIKASDRELVALSRVDCGSVARRAIALMHLAVRETSAEIELGELPIIDSNEALLLQIFQNLIGNALKFFGEASPRIRISCSSTEGEWTFAVSDNGIGIDSSCLEYIFQPLKRMGRNHSGTGLGLTVSRLAVEQLGGRIWVNSTLGSGSTFYFTIPRNPLRNGSGEGHPDSNYPR